MFGTPIPPDSIKAETAYRLERDVLPARRRTPTDQPRLARRALRAITATLPQMSSRYGVPTPPENPNEITSQSDRSQPASQKIREAVSDRR